MRTPLLLGLRPRLLVAFLLIALTARSQQPRPGRTGRQDAAAREQLFIADARALPRLYEKKDFNSISYYIQLRWQPGPIDPDLFCQSILLSVQRHIFYLTDFPDLNSLTPEVVNDPASTPTCSHKSSGIVHPTITPVKVMPSQTSTNNSFSRLPAGHMTYSALGVSTAWKASYAGFIPVRSAIRRNIFIAMPLPPTQMASSPADPSPP